VPHAGTQAGNHGNGKPRIGVLTTGDKPLLAFDRGEEFTMVEPGPRADGLVAVRNGQNEEGLVPAAFLESVRPYANSN
jgi:hypothetical protein